MASSLANKVCYHRFFFTYHLVNVRQFLQKGFINYTGTCATYPTLLIINKSEPETENLKNASKIYLSIFTGRYGSESRSRS